MNNKDFETIKKAGEILRKGKKVCAFTGAGISVESGIPPFRGPNGLWSKFDPIFLDINYFYSNPEKSWKLIKQIFYDFFGSAKPNPAHKGLAELEKNGYIDSIITQNIDNFHQEAGSRNVIEFHGTLKTLTCIDCYKKSEFSVDIFKDLPPRCDCGGVLKPDIVFFGEPIPEPARTLSFKLADESDVFLLIGTTGEIQPASMIPIIAKQKGAKIIEININNSNYTNTITDVFIKEKA